VSLVAAGKRPSNAVLRGPPTIEEARRRKRRSLFPRGAAANIKGDKGERRILLTKEDTA